jgi:hypothetical protein
MSKKTILFVILLFSLFFAARGFSAPVFYWDSSKPSWYDASLQPGLLMEKMIWEYGQANFSSVAITGKISSTAWSVDTSVYLLGGKSLAFTLNSGTTGLNHFTVDLYAAAPLPSVAVRVDGNSPNGYDVSGSLTYGYIDGTNNTFSFSGTGSGSLKTYLDFTRASKPVTWIRVTYGNYWSQVKLYIEYPDYAYETTTIGSSFSVPARTRFNSTMVAWWARFPHPLMSISPSTSVFLDEAYGTATGTYTATLSSYTYVYTLAQNYALTLLDGTLNALASSTGTGKVTVASDVEVTYLKLNTTLLYGASLLNNTTLNPPQAGVTAVTFTVQDYGFGYQSLQAFDLRGSVAASGLITSLGQVALNLTPYASYMLQVCKAGLCKAIGLVTISSSNIQLTVMPSIPAVKPPSLVSASYDYSGKQLIVNVSCASPPCTVTVKKILANGTQTAFASLTCNTQLCSYAISAQDPYFLVTASDSSGKTAQASTGLSVPLWQSPLGSIVGTLGKTMNLDAFGVNVNDFIVFLIGLAIIYTAFTYRNWELGIIVFGVWLTIGTLLLGGSGRLVVPGLSLALVGAALSYMLKREQAP